MAYEGDKSGKRIVNRFEYAFDLHKCPKCDAVFAVTSFALKVPDIDCWSGTSKTPTHCYMCGALMDGANGTQPTPAGSK